MGGRSLVTKVDDTNAGLWTRGYYNFERLLELGRRSLATKEDDTNTGWWTRGY